MQDPFAWSLPFGRLFGITIRIHILFPFVALGLILRAGWGEHAVTGGWIDAAIVVGLLFFSVLLHEFGHCFGARAVQGDASEILIWPLGGLANVEVPHTPRAHFLTTLAGPAVNFVLCLLCLGGLYALGNYQPNWNPLAYVGRGTYPSPEQLGAQIGFKTWGGELSFVSPYSLVAIVGQLFWVNYMLFLFNMVLIGFPMDGGRLLQSVAWNYVGYRRGTLTAIYAGFLTMFVVGLFAVINESTLAVMLALFIYVSCKQQWIILETGGEESLFGYDFSQGYTSLEREEMTSAPPQKRKSWWQRWLERRAARRAQREEEQRVADENRLDELLDKVQREGMNSLSDEERRFMKRVSDRYRNRKP